MTRLVLIAAVALGVSASPAHAQGRAPQQAVLPDSTMKSMIARKPKIKSSLGARVGMVRQPSGSPAKSGPTSPATVREIEPVSKKK